MVSGYLPNNIIANVDIAAKVAVDIALLVMMQKPTGSSFNQRFGMIVVIYSHSKLSIKKIIAL
jgi:hypothetical protein